jgi:signal transduction histidine kinase
MFDRLVHDWEDMSRKLADFNFTRRVQTLNSSLFSDISLGEEFLNEQSFLDEVVKMTALSFGADGAVIRLFEETSGSLNEAAHTGNVDPVMIAPIRPGELLAGRVFLSTERTWGLVETSPQWKTRGCKLDKISIKALRERNINAAVTVRLEHPIPIDNVSSQASNSALGTLSYFYTRPHRFSWRDVALFMGFGRKVADSVSLLRQSNELYQKTRMLEVQAPVATQAELAHLLIHDLSHKVLNIEGDARDLTERVRKELRRHRDNISSETQEIIARFFESIDLMKKEIIDLRNYGKLEGNQQIESSATTFSISDTVQSIVEAMRSALNRQKIEPKLDFRNPMKISGHQKVLEHVLLNLILNTIDAAKSRQTQRPMTMHFHGLEDSGRIRLRIWDTGPGIDQKRFPTPQAVFEIGKSSKIGGTGMGLPVARTLLHRYFRGNLDLVDPKTARFEITFPLKS